MVYGVDLTDIILYTDFSCDYLYIFTFLKAGTYIDTYSVILPEKVAYTDEEDLPVCCLSAVLQACQAPLKRYLTVICRRQLGQMILNISFR